MLPTEFSIASFVASNVTNIVTYTILSLLFSILLYLIIIPIATDIPHSYKLTISLFAPFLLIEFLLRWVFGSFGITLDFGSYTYSLPFWNDITVTNGVMISRLLDFTFNFGLFKQFGLPYFTEFAKTIPAVLPEPSLWFRGLVLLYVSMDSIIDYIFFFVFFTAMIVIFSDIFNDNDIYGLIVAGVVSALIGYGLYAVFNVGFITVLMISGLLFVIMFGVFHATVQTASIHSMWLAAIPTLLYVNYVSNPISEYGTAIVELQKIWYFWQHADSWSLIVYFGTLIVSFIIVMEIIAATIDLFYRIGATTIRPSWESKPWMTSYQGTAFGFTLAFGIMYSMHNYAYYIFFPILILYGLFKKISGGIIETAKIRGEKMELQQANVGNREKKEVEIPQSTGHVDARGGGLDIGMVLVIIGIVGLLVLAWTKMG